MYKDFDEEKTEEQLLAEQEKEWKRISAGKELNSKIRELAPVLDKLPYEALICAKYALMYMKRNTPNELIPFPREDGTAPEIPAHEVVSILHIESLVKEA